MVRVKQVFTKNCLVKRKISGVVGKKILYEDKQFDSLTRYISRSGLSMIYDEDEMVSFSIIENQSNGSEEIIAQLLSEGKKQEAQLIRDTTWNPILDFRLIQMYLFRFNLNDVKSMYQYRKRSDKSLFLRLRLLLGIPSVPKDKNEISPYIQKVSNEENEKIFRTKLFIKKYYYERMMRYCKYCDEKEKEDEFFLRDLDSFISEFDFH